MKLILFLICNILIFTRKNFLFGILIFALILALTLLLGDKKIGIKYLLRYIILLILEHIFINSEIIFLGILSTAIIFIRLLMPVILFANTIIITSRLNELMSALYSFKIPKSFVITLIISIRFFPTLKRELNCIYDGMKLRGYRLNIKNIIFRPKKMINALLIPTIMRSSIIADEIGIAAVTRGIDNPKERTRFTEFSIGKKDIAIFTICIFLLALFLYLSYIF